MVFGSVFRFTEEKRPFLLIDMAAEISSRAARPPHFVIVGDGPLLEPVRVYVEQSGLRNVALVGRKSDVHDWYSAMDAFLLTSSVEGMSNAVIEAQYSKLPIICFDVGGLAEAVPHGSTGFLIPDGAREEFVDAALRFAEAPDLARQMGQQAHDFVTGRFTLDRLV